MQITSVAASNFFYGEAVKILKLEIHKQKVNFLNIIKLNIEYVFKNIIMVVDFESLINKLKNLKW